MTANARLTYQPFMLTCTCSSSGVQKPACVSVVVSQEDQFRSPACLGTIGVHGCPRLRPMELLRLQIVRALSPWKGYRVSEQSATGATPLAASAEQPCWHPILADRLGSGTGPPGKQQQTHRAASGRRGSLQVHVNIERGGRSWSH